MAQAREDADNVYREEPEAQSSKKVPSQRITVEDSLDGDCLKESDSAGAHAMHHSRVLDSAHAQSTLHRREIDSAHRQLGGDPQRGGNDTAEPAASALPVADLQHAFALSAPDIADTFDKGLRMNLEQSANARLLDAWQHNCNTSGVSLLIIWKISHQDEWNAELHSIYPEALRWPSLRFSITEHNNAGAHLDGRYFELLCLSEQPYEQWKDCSLPCASMLAPGSIIRSSDGKANAPSALVRVYAGKQTSVNAEYLGSTPDCRSIECLKLHSSGYLLAGCTDGCVVRWHVPSSPSDNWPSGEILCGSRCSSLTSALVQLEEVEEEHRSQRIRSVVGCHSNGSVSVWGVDGQNAGLLGVFCDSTFIVHAAVPLTLGPRAIEKQIDFLDEASMPLLTLMTPKLWSNAELECRVAWLKGGEDSLAPCDTMPFEAQPTCISCRNGVAIGGMSNGEALVWQVRDGELLATLNVCSSRTAVKFVKALKAQTSGYHVCVAAFAESGACVLVNV